MLMITFQFDSNPQTFDLRLTYLLQRILVSSFVFLVFTPKILNGYSARRYLAPFQAAIYRSKVTHPICGGAVLTENYIITAAQCVIEFRHSTSDDYVFVSDHYVLVSDYQVGNSDDGQERHEIESIKIHEDFQLSRDYTLLNDIALIKLKTPARSGKVTPICLPPPSGTIVPNTCFYERLNLLEILFYVTLWQFEFSSNKIGD